jgi:UDP-N-acetylglucosamine 4-epimerase
MRAIESAKVFLQKNKLKWLITGVAGFIGSNLLESLLKLNQEVVGIDNFSTGSHQNLDEVLNGLPVQQRNNFKFYYGDICLFTDCDLVTKGIDCLLHQAALGSVPRSIKDPIATNNNNVTGFLNILTAAKNNQVKRLVYASSSSVYGDSPLLPKEENHFGNLLSPYAVSKFTNELYASVFARVYGMEIIGLRYFNVFGPRQSSDGSYAAVIPLWLKALLSNEDVIINGDGTTTRDFCYVANAVQANILAALTTNDNSLNKVYNIAVGDRTSLERLFRMMVEILHLEGKVQPKYREFREGDIKDSLASIAKAHALLGYEPTHMIYDGLKATMEWYKSIFCN